MCEHDEPSKSTAHMRDSSRLRSPTPVLPFSLARTQCQGFGFLGFIVDDFDGASKCLRAKGAKEIPEPTIYEGKLARFADPDGYHVQLALRKAVLE